jgi:SAM-dependent methyltransferase
MLNRFWRHLVLAKGSTLNADWTNYWDQPGVAERFADLPPNHSKALLEEKPIADVVEECETFLDAGAGAGRYIPLLHSKVGVYVAADLSQRMLKFAKKRFGHFENVHFIRCDLEYPPFREETFETVLCVAVLRHLPLDKAERVFKKLLNLTCSNFYFTAHVSEGVETNLVGWPKRIIDHSFTPDSFSIWSLPYKISRVLRLTNEPNIERYLFHVDKKQIR